MTLQESSKIATNAYAKQRKLQEKLFHFCQRKNSLVPAFQEALHYLAYKVLI